MDMKIISYNIWDLPLIFLRNRTGRMLEIGQLLAREHMHIICLQESWSLHNRKALSQYLRSQGYHDAIHQAGIRRRNGGLLTFSKFPIKSVRFFPFGRWGLSVSEFIGNKGILETIVETPRGLLRVLNLHLHHETNKLFKAKGIRLRQLRNLLRHELSDHSMPTVLAGDFNQHDMLGDSSFAALFEKMGFMHHADPQILVPTYRKENRFVNNWLNRIRESERYDYILYKDIEKIDLHFSSYAPWHIDPPLSDHDPVVLALSTGTGAFQ